MELVLLVAAGVGVRHEIEHVRVGRDGRGRCKVELDLGLLVQGEALDAQQRVGLGVADHAPPVLLSLLREERRDHWAGHFVLSLHRHVHVDLATERNALLVGHIVRELDVRVAVAELGHVGHLARVQLEQLVAVLVLHVHDVKDALDLLGLAALDDVACKVRQLLQVRVLVPHGLSAHLRQLHGRQGRTQPAVGREHINTRLDQSDRLQTSTDRTIREVKQRLAKWRPSNHDRRDRLNECDQKFSLSDAKRISNSLI